jgi:hypothetical protein
MKRKRARRHRPTSGDRCSPLTAFATSDGVAISSIRR